MDQSLTQPSTDKERLDRLDLILSILEQLTQDLHLSKCDIKTAIRDIGMQQESLSDSVVRLRVILQDIDARLHGIELRQQRQNSST